MALGLLHRVGSEAYRSGLALPIFSQGYRYTPDEVPGPYVEPILTSFSVYRSGNGNFSPLGVKLLRRHSEVNKCARALLAMTSLSASAKPLV